MARREKKPVHKVVMTEGKRNIIQQLLHNPSVQTTDLPYTRRELSCRISPSRPEILSLFLCAFFQLQHVPIKVGHEQSVLDNAILFKFCLSMKLCNFCGHLTRIL